MEASNISKKVFAMFLFPLLFLLLLFGCTQPAQQQGNAPDASGIESQAKELEQGINSASQTDNELNSTDLGNWLEPVNPSDLGAGTPTAGTALTEPIAAVVDAGSNELSGLLSDSAALDSALTDFSALDSIVPINASDLGP